MTFRDDTSPLLFLLFLLLLLLLLLLPTLLEHLDTHLHHTPLSTFRLGIRSYLHFLDHLHTPSFNKVIHFLFSPLLSCHSIFSPFLSSPLPSPLSSVIFRYSPLVLNSSHAKTSSLLQEPSISCSNEHHVTDCSISIASCFMLLQLLPAPAAISWPITYLLSRFFCGCPRMCKVKRVCVEYQLPFFSHLQRRRFTRYRGVSHVFC